jgi:hypothetical protein
MGGLLLWVLLGLLINIPLPLLVTRRALLRLVLLLRGILVWLALCIVLILYLIWGGSRVPI